MIYRTNIREDFGSRLGGKMGCIYELAATRETTSRKRQGVHMKNLCVLNNNKNFMFAL